jgi:hypothetical protein
MDDVRTGPVAFNLAHAVRRPPSRPAELSAPVATATPDEQPTAASPAPPAATGGGHRSHRVIVATLFVVAVIVGFVAVFAVWVNRQVLNTKNWTNTSGKLLADPAIQTAVGAYLVNQLYASVNVANEIQGLLPSDISGLAGPAAAGLRQVADQVAPQLLARPEIQSAWEKANTVAHAEFLHIINGGGPAVSTGGGNVTLNLNTIVDQLAKDLGVQSQVATVQSKLQGSTGASVRSTAQQKLGITLPANIGQLTVLRSKQLKTVQDVVKGIKSLSVWLTVLTIALFVLAVWLAQGWRRIALRRTGWCFIGLGAVLVFARRVIGNRVIDSLVTTDSVKPAAHDAWFIGTTLLYDIAIALIAYGIVIVLAAWLAGGTRAAVGLRRALAPELRERPVPVYLAVGFVFLLLLLWGPTPAFKQATTIIGMIVLIVLGIQTLRHQTAVEFPDGQLGDATARFRVWVDERRHRRHAVVVHGNGALDAERMAQLERAAALHERGVLTDAEFAAQKASIMNGS